MAGIWDVTPVIVVTMFVLGIAGVIVYERIRIRDGPAKPAED